MGVQGLKQANSYSNAGRIDNSLKDYFDIPEYVIRNGKKVNIKENNARIMGKK